MRRSRRSRSSVGSYDRYNDPSAIENRSRIARTIQDIQIQSYRQQLRKTLSLVPVRRVTYSLTRAKPRTLNGLKVTSAFAATKPMHRNRLDVSRCIGDVLSAYSKKAKRERGSGGGSRVSIPFKSKVDTVRRVIQAARRSC